MAEAQKARSEAEQIRADLEGKEEELDNREAEIERKESELAQEIEKEAEILTEGLRFDLEEEYKRKEAHIWQMSQTRERVTADKYKKLTIKYQAEFTIVLFYAVIATALKVISTPEIMADAIQFIVNLWNTLVGFVVDVIGFGHTVAGISQLIPNPTVAGIVFWVLQILISVIAIGIVFLTIYSLIITYVRYMKAKQFDRYTVIVAITVLAFTVFLAENSTYKPLCASNKPVSDLFRNTGFWSEEKSKSTIIKSIDAHAGDNPVWASILSYTGTTLYVSINSL